MTGYRAEGTVCNGRRSLQNSAEGLGDGVSSSVGSGQRPGGGQGAKPPEALKILKFTSLKRGQKLTLMVHFDPRHANDNIRDFKVIQFFTLPSSFSSL